MNWDGLLQFKAEEERLMVRKQEKMVERLYMKKIKNIEQKWPPHLHIHLKMGR